MNLQIAINIAKCAHQGQVDKSGNDYFLHPLRVMNKLETEEEKIVGILHDIIEDTTVSLDDLKNLGFSEKIMLAIDSLTKRKKESYRNFIERVGQNELGKLVKLADLEDNMNLSRLQEITQKDINRTIKYKQAVFFLTNGVWEDKQ